MASGGARSRSGPVPDLSSLRRADETWVTLDPAGRPGDPPPWPFATQTARELTMWERLWARPEALWWEATMVSHDLVGLYCRRFAEAEMPEAPVNLSTLVRQLGEDLALTPTGRARAKLRIGEPAPARKRAAKKRPARKASARDRLRVVNGGD